MMLISSMATNSQVKISCVLSLTILSTWWWWWWWCSSLPLCAGALWPMPAWVWRDVRSVFFFCVSTAGLFHHQIHRNSRVRASCEQTQVCLKASIIPEHMHAALMLEAQTEAGTS